MPSSFNADELTRYLREQGHTDREIAHILERVRQYDDATRHDSVMDSVGAGRMNLAKIIEEALRDLQ